MPGGGGGGAHTVSDDKLLADKLAQISAEGDLKGRNKSTISVTDMISEGPIEGLVNSTASVFLNNDQQSINDLSGVSLSKGPHYVSLVNGAKSAKIVLYGGRTMQSVAGKAHGWGPRRFLAVRDSTPTLVKRTAVGNASGDAVVLYSLTSWVSSADVTTLGAPGILDKWVPVRLVSVDRPDTSVTGYIYKIDGAQKAYFREGYFSGGRHRSSTQILPSKIDGYWYAYIDRVVEIDKDAWGIYVDGRKIREINASEGTYTYYATLEENWDLDSGNYKFDDLGFDFQVGGLSVGERIMESESVLKDPGTQVQFRVGTLTQPPFYGQGGTGSTAVTNKIGQSISQTSESSYGGDQDPINLDGLSSAGFNLSANQMAMVDEVKVRIDYPGGHYGINGKGDKAKTYTQYKMSIYFKKGTATSFASDPEDIFDVLHVGKYQNATTFEETFDLEQHRPFKDFRIKIERATSDNDPGYRFLENGVPQTHHDWTNVTKAQVSNVTSIFKEKLGLPLTAAAKVSYSTKTYQDLPKRSYHCKGMLVKVPSNYVTRDETGGAATYNRNVTTGAAGSTYQDWDGNFRDEKVYTNNPAWIFYDIVTNNRYGLGDFVKETDIDKYALYRISRYCDEEVDDGSGAGTTEPRYTMNTYLTKATDAFKVLKDMLSNFLSMLYYLDGKIYPVQDSPAGPVYAFSKANVIDGAFSYESTGSKTRVNQVIVKWNDPAHNYQLEPLIVEDRRNIAETGNIISQEAVAYGCTSEGQATRYGQWKLWTAANQQEIVSFSTGINGSYITPGDIILVQDADRYATRYSGRISNTGTRDRDTIPLDSSVTLNSGSTYELSVIMQGPVAFLAQESATIQGVTAAGCSFDSADTTVTHTSNTDIKVGMAVAGLDIPANTTVASVTSDTVFELNQNTTGARSGVGLTLTDTYSEGDIIQRAFVNGSITDIDTPEKAANAKAAAADADALLLNWKDDFRVETQSVTLPSLPATVTELNLSSPLYSVPTAEDLWILTETASGLTVAGSGKEYRVMSLAQNEKNTYDIVAVEHFDEKYDAVEETFTTYVAETVYPPVRSTDPVLPPKDVWMNASRPHKVTDVWNGDITLHWSYPEAELRSVTKDDGTQGYEPISPEEAGLSMQISHNFPEHELRPNPLIVSGDTEVTFGMIPAGTYQVVLRTINSIGNKSVGITREFTISQHWSSPNIRQLPRGFSAGGTSTTPLEIL